MILAYDVVLNHAWFSENYEKSFQLKPDVARVGFTPTTSLIRFERSYII